MAVVTLRLDDVRLVHGRLLHIDLLRAAAVTYIVGFWHLMGYTGGYAPGFSNDATTRLTVLALGTFFYISGFLLGKSTPPTSAADIWQFYKRRALRIYPLFLFAIILFFLTKSAHRSDLLSAVFLTSAFTCAKLKTLWFVGVLFCFYAVTPALIVVSSEAAKFLAVAICIWLLFAVLQTISPDPDSRLLLYFPAFALGVFFANRSLTTAQIAAVGVGSAAALAVSFLTSQSPEKSLFSTAFAALAPLMLVAVSEKMTVPRPLMTPVAIVSYASFAMYLLHRPLYKELVRLVPHGPGRLVLLLGVGFPLLVFVSYNVQKFYDGIQARAAQRAA